MQLTKRFGWPVLFIQSQFFDRELRGHMRRGTMSKTVYHRLGEIEIVIAEITSNLVKHATKGGFILARSITENGRGMEMIAMDEGPGMRMVAKMMEDGQSTKKNFRAGAWCHPQVVQRI